MLLQSGQFEAFSLHVSVCVVNSYNTVVEVALQWYSLILKCTVTDTLLTLYTHTLLTAFLRGLPGWAGTRKVKLIWILLKQETASGSGISWAICKSAPCSRQITMSAPHHSTGWVPFLPPNQQHQSTEGNITDIICAFLFLTVIGNYSITCILFSSCVWEWQVHLLKLI